MWNQLAVWCSLPTNEYKWCNWFTVPMIWVCPKIGYPKIIQYLCVLPQGLHPHIWTSPRLRCEDFFVEPRPRHLKRENSQALQSFTLEYTLTLGLPLAPDFSSLSCDSWLRLRNEKNHHNCLQKFEFPGEWACIDLPRVWLLLAQLRDFRMPRKWEWRLTYQNLPWNLQIAMEHPMNTARPWPRKEWKDYRNAWWCMAIWHPHYFNFRPKIRLNYSVILSGWWF